MSFIEPHSPSLPDHQLESQSPKSKVKVSESNMDIDNTADQKHTQQVDPIAQIQNFDLLSDIFGLLHDLQTGVILAKDIDSHAGSIRLKISKLKQNLQEIDGIHESIKYRQQMIESLKCSNRKKLEFLKNFKDRVNRELD
ncbi:uncharacterized protein PRCAT00003723001 [Priceomyces carsonii]|uniref:uncharacterized protein n=1 Tax=Priceomyces carsonii TaxID=28549 RepID=UPI002EDB5EDA|nr:unnamed protein product [Priceomyces carsonii]